MLIEYLDFGLRYSTLTEQLRAAEPNILAGKECPSTSQGPGSTPGCIIQVNNFKTHLTWLLGSLFLLVGHGGTAMGGRRVSNV